MISINEAINIAINGLELIKKYTEMLEDSINESRLVYEADLDSDDLVDCENLTRLETYRTCLEMFNYLKQSIMNIGGQNNEL